MSNACFTPDDMQSLIDAAMNGSITAEQAADLQTLLENDRKACEIYAEYARIEAELHLLTRGRMANQAVCREIGLQWTYGESISDDESYGIVLPASSTPVPSGGVWQGTITTFSQIGPLSYLIATVILSVMLLGAWAYKINHHDHFVNDQSPSIQQTERQFVGQVTGMKDCRWVDGDAGTMVGASVPLSRKYELISGLLEITYTSGARVILEGPCTYKVDSNAGGYLALGKLTARVEKKKAQVVHPSSFRPHPSSLFSVTTPTAVVTDLGTEFGVEVDQSGRTTSFVFRGLVQVRAVGAEQKDKILLRADESVRVEKNGKGYFARPETPPKFVRRLYNLPEQLDLLDIVAGGNGLGHRRESGVDSQTGINEPVFYRYPRDESNGYQPVTWHKFIDGVFIPHGGKEPVQVDSAGHIFTECPETEGKTWGSIWSRDAGVKEPELAKTTIYWIYAMGRGERFMPDGRGLLCSSANMGITFDLENIRKTFRDVHPDRFKGTLGMADAHFHVPNPTSLADAWVLVDGKVKFKRLGMKPEDTVVNIDVDLEPTDRFLTIVFTDGGNTHAHDWMVIGDPVLHLNAD